MLYTPPSPFVSPFTSPFARQSGPAPSKLESKSKITPSEMSLPRYVNYLGDYSGCGHWRVLWPEQLINIRGDGCSTSLTSMVFDPRWYQGLRCIKIQRQASKAQRDFVVFLKSLQKEHGFKLIYEVDDVVFEEDIPDYNKFKTAFVGGGIRQNCIDIINMCDEVTVTCKYMKELYQERTGKKEITVVPNFVPNFWLGHLYNRRKNIEAYENNTKRPRVLYTGSGAHYDVDNKVGGKDDFEHVLQLIIDTRHQYQWVFVGAFPPPLLKYVQSREIEFHPWQNLLKYPKLISDLNAQVMIAPLQDNSFNKSKSDIKFVEAAILGIPCLCQDLPTYSTAPESLKFTTAENLKYKLEAILNYKNRKQYKENIELLRDYGVTRLMENDENIGCHIEALSTPFNSPDRKYLKRWNS
jgi:hypothetical protein